jgi:hypothetical protein
MGTQHKAITNCTSCGKVICEREGIGCCGFCGTLTHLPLSSEEAEQAGLGEALLTAVRHKDKLLRFDREHTKRTQVHDAQADYYTSTNWLTPEEKQQMEEKEKKRQETLLRSSKRMMVPRCIILLMHCELVQCRYPSTLLAEGLSR